MRGDLNGRETGRVHNYGGEEYTRGWGDFVLFYVFFNIDLIGLSYL